MSLASYISKAEEVSSNVQSVRRAIETYSEVLRESLRKYGEIVNLRTCGRYVFVGDIHGSLNDLKEILERYSREQLARGEVALLFLGDYIDRGEHQLEVLLTLLEIKVDYPESVFLLLGNHEGVNIIEPSPHDFPDELIARYLLRDGLEVYRHIVEEVFAYLHVAAYLRDSFLAVHGGLPVSSYRKAQSIREYLLGAEDHVVKETLIEVLWNDPIESNEEGRPSPRGAGMLFGRPVTEWVTKTLNVKLVIRGHEPCIYGYKFNHGFRVLTLFSRRGPPYFNPKAAYLDLDLSDKNWPKYVRETKYIHLL
jgi:protein phosphatase